MRHGWHPLRSYAVFYAFHQYPLHRGFIVLCLNYGGYMTVGALTRHPKAFAMGINIAGIIDWLQWSTWRDARYPERQLLNLMGSGDEAVDFAHLDEIIRLCTKHRKDFAALYYPGESHAFTYRDTWADAYRRMERAFDRYLRCRPDQRPPAML